MIQNLSHSNYINDFKSSTLNRKNSDFKITTNFVQYSILIRLSLIKDMIILVFLQPVKRLSSNYGSINSHWLS